MSALTLVSENSHKLGGCWHSDKLYLKSKPDDKVYGIRFEECDRTTREWMKVHLLDYQEGLIGTKKIHKLVVKDAEKEDSTPFLIIAETYTTGQFNPQQGSDDGQGNN